MRKLKQTFDPPPPPTQTWMLQHVFSPSRAGQDSPVFLLIPASPATPDGKRNHSWKRWSRPDHTTHLFLKASFIGPLSCGGLIAALACLHQGAVLRARFFSSSPLPSFLHLFLFFFFCILVCSPSSVLMSTELAWLHT